MERHARSMAVAVLCATLCASAIATPALLTWIGTERIDVPPAPEPRGAQVSSPGEAGVAPRPASQHRPAQGAEAQVTDGALRLADGTFCPLTHTDVKAEISGLVARVTLTQQFVNPSADRVEAVYTFPLPQHAAVDDMTLTTGGRVIRGVIARREEARQIYERAREAGHTAALLEQERPNIFTQSVANIPPNGPVTIEISYVELLDYDEGRYAFVFPMVVGPRYVPGRPTGASGGGWSPDTSQVPDASRITPPVAGVHVGERDTRAGHDIALSVRLDAGVPIQSIASVTHETTIERPTASTALVRLHNEREIPNRDFVLTYDTSGLAIEEALLAHARQDGGGTFALILQPPERVADEEATPRELVFVLDTSGSMRGYPIETAKAVVRRAIASLRAGDTFNLVTFAGDIQVLFPEPVPPTGAHVERALAWLDGQRGGGGTEMMTAIRTALGRAGRQVTDAEPGDAPARVQAATPGTPMRLVCFVTDGYVGNDMEIIGEVQKHPDARVFSIGIGSAVNRFLLDGLAHAGRGEVEYVTRAEDAERAADRFHERIRTPVLTDITVDWGTLPVAQVLPARVPDLFAARPLVLLGRYTKPATGVATIRGAQAGRAFVREVHVSLPAVEARHGVVAQLWARRQIGELMARDWSGLQRGTPAADLQERITQLGLDYRLMTPFTAFIAVEEQVVVEQGQRRTIQVPVDLPHNVSPEGVFGEAAGLGPQKAAVRVGGNLQRSAIPAGVVGGVVGGVPEAPPPAAAPLAQPSLYARQGARDEAATRAAAERRGPPLDETLARKLHVSLLRTVECALGRQPVLETGPACPEKAESHVHVRIVLSASPGAELLRRLETAGLELSPRAKAGSTLATIVTGRIAVARLATLAALPEVVLIARTDEPGR